MGALAAIEVKKTRTWHGRLSGWVFTERAQFRQGVVPAQDLLTWNLEG